MARLLSVNVGLPQNISWRGRTVYTGIWKSAVDGPRVVRHLDVDGDGQGDLAGHGGEYRAVYVYQVASYRYWESELHRDDFVMGQFGENFTVDGLSDGEVCVGDRFRIGTAVFEVTQPRVTCYRVGIRMNEPRMAALLTARGKPGFYFRVLEEGTVQAGDDIVQIAQGPERMTIEQINALLYLPGHSRDDLERALRIPALSPGWRNSFQTLLEHGDGANGNPGLSPADLTPVAWAGFRRVRIAELNHETSSVVSIVLVAAEGDALTPALPGQFVIVRLHPQPDAAPVMRSFSLCGAPDATGYRLGIKREENGVASTYIAERAQVGDIIEVSAPRGVFVLEEGTRPVVLLSGGIGITPVLAMLYALASRHSQREIWWLHGNRSGSDYAFGGEARNLLGALPNAHGYVRYSRPDETDLAGRDFDSEGHIDAALISQLGISQKSDFYMCGPPAFLTDLRKGLTDWGVAPTDVHAETFGSGPSQTPGIADAPKRAPHPPEGVPGTGPSVSFARSNLIVPWGPDYQSLLELAEACDVPVRWSCRTGVCHTCESGLVSGAVRYDPEPLDPPAAGNLLICCSTPENDVVLDL